MANSAASHSLSQLQSANGALKLAGFQVRACERILRAVETDKALATIVCAGTGSGKTLAFYMPALASTLRHKIEQPNDSPWVKVVALYPRTELLKDQLREVLGRTAALHGKLAEHPIRIGALFGDTPRTASDCEWELVGSDRICPITRCHECGGEFRWAQAASAWIARDQIAIVREQSLCGLFALRHTAQRELLPSLRHDGVSIRI